MNLLKNAILIAIVLIVQSAFSFSFDCSLPSGCLIKPLKYAINDKTYEKHQFIGNAQEIMCKPTKGFQFRFLVNAFMANKSKRCNLGNASLIRFVWENKNEPIILDKSFNVSNILPYIGYLKSKAMVWLVNLRGFESD